VYQLVLAFLLVGDVVGIGHVGGEEHRGSDRLEFQLDACLLAGLFDDGLGFLAWGVDRGLIYKAQFLAVLHADPTRLTLPATRLQ
jgi:hypothetical protein